MATDCPRYPANTKPNRCFFTTQEKRPKFLEELLQSSAIIQYHNGHSQNPEQTNLHVLVGWESILIIINVLQSDSHFVQKTVCVGGIGMPAYTMI